MLAVRGQHREHAHGDRRAFGPPSQPCPATRMRPDRWTCRRPTGHPLTTGRKHAENTAGGASPHVPRSQRRRPRYAPGRQPGCGCHSRRLDVGRPRTTSGRRAAGAVGGDGRAWSRPGRLANTEPAGRLDLDGRRSPLVRLRHRRTRPPARAVTPGPVRRPGAGRPPVSFQAGRGRGPGGADSRARRAGATSRRASAAGGSSVCAPQRQYVDLANDSTPPTPR